MWSWNVDRGDEVDKGNTVLSSQFLVLSSFIRYSEQIAGRAIGDCRKPRELWNWATFSRLPFYDKRGMNFRVLWPIAVLRSHVLPLLTIPCPKQTVKTRLSSWFLPVYPFTNSLRKFIFHRGSQLLWELKTAIYFCVYRTPSPWKTPTRKQAISRTKR